MEFRLTNDPFTLATPKRKNIITESGNQRERLILAEIGEYINQRKDVIRRDIRRASNESDRRAATLALYELEAWECQLEHNFKHFRIVTEDNINAVKQTIETRGRR